MKSQNAPPLISKAVTAWHSYKFSGIPALNDAIAIIGCRQVICAISVCCVPLLNVLDNRFKKRCGALLRTGQNCPAKLFAEFVKVILDVKWITTKTMMAGTVSRDQPGNLIRKEAVLKLPRVAFKKPTTSVAVNGSIAW
ncbi:hypothetical protein [Roseobacter sp.]|uniref:hypothetical protein n=1 Tax=Roseobacter sp. TaxID=1907202 RepID=UPI00296779F4|nr:hypothetical protein [Roseobacter sp.]MDW3182178.1 hypothetical protein [Roseobacter sp.]